MKTLKAKLLWMARQLGYVPMDGLHYNEWNTKYLYLYDLYRKIENVEGDIVECGVERGHTLVALSIFVQREKKGRKVYGFDSFEGFPEPLEVDSSPRNPQKGELSVTSLNMVTKLAQKAQVSIPTLVKGFFCDTIPHFKIDKIAFLHIDADMYEGYHDALKLSDKVSKGGIIAFDEYNRPNWPGAKKAVDDFIAKTGETLNKDKHSGKYYVIKS